MLHKILVLLDRGERWRLAILLFLATITGLAQIVGVGSIMPFVGVLTNPELAHESGALSRVHGLLGAPQGNTFLMMLGSGVLAAFIVSNALISFTQWYTFRFAHWNQYRISRRLLETYLSRPYAYHIHNNSADAGKNILTETQAFTGQVLLPGLQALAFGISAIFIAAFLVWLDPLVACVVVGAIGGTYTLIYLTLRHQLRRVGANRLRANTGRFKAANEAFGAIKEVKSTGREAAFLERYDPDARRFAHAQATLQILTQLPRHMIEVIGVGIVLLMALLLVAAGHGATTILPLISVYAIGGLRLLPAFQHIYNGVSQLRGYAPAIDALHSELMASTTPDSGLFKSLDPSDRLAFHRAIELNGVTFYYPGRETPALQKVTLTIRHGTSVALVGETGAGKTTLADVILGLLSPQEGQILVDGVPLDKGNLRRWRANIGYVPQHIYLADDSVAANIAFGISGKLINLEAVEQAARIANIHEFIVNDLPQGYDTLVGERGVLLSGGQRQRIGIARALYHDPEVLILDEATSALDSITEQQVLQAIKRVAELKTLVVIAHRFVTIRNCSVLYLLEGGRIVASGSYDELEQTHERFRKMSKAAV